MTRLAPLISAVKEAQQADPLSNPVTVLCMPGARDDVIIGLTEEGALSNVRILTLRMLLSTQFPNLLKESELSALVVRELQNLPESSPIKQKKLASEPATRAGVVRAVGELIQHPQELWAHHGPSSLPKEIEGIARNIAEST